MSWKNDKYPKVFQFFFDSSRFFPMLLITFALAFFSACSSQTTNQTASQTSPLPPSTMKLSSPAFENNASIPSKYTCDDQNISPPLQISDTPTSAKSLVLIVHDPDAPSGDWVHWLIWNIDPTTTEIAVNSVPKNAVQGTTDFKKSGWGGPCPPSGTHHYHFVLYALDTPLNLDSSAKRSDLEKAITGHIIAQTELVGLYKRK